MLTSPADAAAKKRDKRPVALLLPLTGERAQLGLSMSRAAMLAESDSALTIAFDTGGTPGGAQGAALAAIKRKVAMILGPVSAAETRAVASAVAGRVPVIAFTNDATAASADSYAFGLTPAQTTSAVLRYARSRGVRNVVVVGDGTPWSDAASAVATRMQGELGLDVRAMTVTPGQPLPAAGDPPDAVLIPSNADSVIGAARGLKDTGIQLLATVQALDNRPSALAALDGAWLAAPDPAAFGRFSSEYEAKNGGGTGALAALCYDAAMIVRTLRDAGTLGAAGLLASNGFDCVMGRTSFRTDGSCARDLAILVAGPAGYQSVATSRGA